MQTDYQRIEEQQKEQERQRDARVRRFAEALLTLGPDIALFAGVGQRQLAEIAEAVEVAAGKWSQLLSLEEQLPRDRAALAVLERGRVPDGDDAYIPADVVAGKDARHRERIQGEREGLKQLTDEAKRLRTALEEFLPKKSRR